MNAVEWRKVAFGTETLHWRGVTKESESGQALAQRLHTKRGDIIARYHPAPVKVLGTRDLGVVGSAAPAEDWMDRRAGYIPRPASACRSAVLLACACIIVCLTN